MAITIIVTFNILSRKNTHSLGGGMGRSHLSRARVKIRMVNVCILGESSEECLSISPYSIVKDNSVLCQEVE